MNEYLEFCKSGQRDRRADSSELSENIQRRMWMSKTQVNVRVTEGDLHNYDDVISSSFPMCSKAYKDGLWASYRRDKVVVSKKKDSRESPQERGIPKVVLAEKNIKIESLHEMFCVFESLFLQIDTDQKYQAIRKNPALLASTNLEWLSSPKKN